MRRDAFLYCTAFPGLFLGLLFPNIGSAQVLPRESDHEVIRPFDTDKPPFDLSGFKVPNLTKEEEDRILAKYRTIDPHHLIPTSLLRSAVIYFDFNLTQIPNKKYLTVVDFSRFSGKKRIFFTDMQTGSVFAAHVAHGSGSDPLDTGYARMHSNVPGSEASSVGFYLVSEIYTGKFGKSIRLDGLSETNSFVRLRDVVMHTASYVDETPKQKGRTWGCLGLAASTKDRVVDLISQGSLLYAGRGNGTADDYFSKVPGRWENRIYDGRNWTIFTYDMVEKFGGDLLSGAQDMTQFCPRFSHLTHVQKVSFWVYLASIIAEFSSDYNSTLRTPGSGNDAVTGLPLFTEGLLQVSYQDKKNYSCDELDWSADKTLSPTDPTKTILSPVNNLICGIRILDAQIHKHERIAYSGDQYWALLNSSSAKNKIAAISKLTSAIPFCH